MTFRTMSNDDVTEPRYVREVPSDIGLAYGSHQHLQEVYTKPYHSLIEY